MQGSALRCQLDKKSQEVTEEARQHLKSQLRLGWSAEAVKQGVAHAKKGEYDAALGCYKKVGLPAWLLLHTFKANALCKSPPCALTLCFPVTAENDKHWHNSILSSQIVHL